MAEVGGAAAYSVLDAATALSGSSQGQSVSQYDIDLRRQLPVGTRYQHLQVLEVSGTPQPTAELPRCYRALATYHRGLVLLIYVAGSPDTFAAHHAAVEAVLHSIAPYSPRQLFRQVRLVSVVATTYGRLPGAATG